MTYKITPKGYKNSIVIRLFLDYSIRIQYDQMYGKQQWFRVIYSVDGIWKQN